MLAKSQSNVNIRGFGRYLLSNNWAIIIFFAGLSIILRFFSFFPTVINHDESTYLVIGDAIRQGKLYFVDLIDTKPIGIFLLLAAFHLVVGKSIFIFRALTALWIALTAYGLFRVQLSIGGERRVGLAAGSMYIFLLSVFTFYGLSPNTEVFFAPFAIWALWLILNRLHWLQDILAGLLLGLGFLIKYVILFDALAFGLFLLWAAERNRQQLGIVLLRCITMIIFFILPFGLCYYFYWKQGHADDFLFYTFEVTSRYPVARSMSGSVLYVLDFFVRFFPVTLMAIYCWFDRSLALKKLKILTLIWGICVITTILLPGKLFGHYWIQFMPPFVLLAAEFFNSRRQRPLWIRKIPLSWRYGLLGLLVTVLITIQKRDKFDQVDEIAMIAKDLENRLEAGDGLYIGNYHHILYYLLDLESPTPYVHRSLLWNPHHRQAFQIDLEEETENILAKTPRFILLQQDTPNNLLSDSIYLHYQKVAFHHRGVELYERKLNREQ